MNLDSFLFAFTVNNVVNNVVIHGVPYIALIYFYMHRRQADRDGSPTGGFFRTLFLLLATIWFFAYVEELFWERAIR